MTSLSRISKAVLTTEMLGGNFRAPEKHFQDSLEAGEALHQGDRLELDFWHDWDEKHSIASVQDLEAVNLKTFAELTGKQLAAELSFGPVSGVALLSDAHGKIDQLLFHAELGPATTTEQKDAWTILSKNLSPDAEVMVATSSQSMADRLGENPNHEEITFFPVSSGDDIWGPSLSLWARDSMIAAANEVGEPVLLMPERDYRPGGGDSLVPFALDRNSENIHTSLKPSLRTRGGNVLANSHTAFVGRQSFEATKKLMQHLHPDMDPQAAAEQVFEKSFGKPIEVLPQAEFDLDVFCHPLDDTTFAVADPRLALDSINALSARERTAVNEKMSEMLGYSRTVDVLAGLVENTPTTEPYDEVVSVLQEKGYRVVRTPYLRGQANVSPFLAYTNCLLESYQDENGDQVKRAFLPRYGCEPLDKLAASIYQAEGFETVGVDLSQISKHMGQLRCMSQVLRRSQAR